MQHKSKVWEGRVDAVRDRIEETALWRIWERMLEIEFVDRSVALGAKAFISLFPFVIVVAAFTGPAVRRSIISTLETRLGLSGNGLVIAKRAFATSADTRRATGILGLVLMLLYATSFTTALQRVFLKAWRRPRGSRVQNHLRGSAVLAGLLAYAALVGGARHFLLGEPRAIVFAVLSAVGTSVLWWLIAWLMLQGQVRWRALVSCAVVTGLSLVIYGAVASLWMPRAVASDQRQFGFFGVALALVSWLVGASALVLLGACSGAVLADAPGRLGRVARGSGPILRPEAPSALPPPTRPLRLVDAFDMTGADDSET